MDAYRYQHMIVIALTLLSAFVLTILPLPKWIVWWRPMWVFMVLLFWMIMEPDYVGVGVSFIVGLWVDLLLGTLLGQHALLFSIVAYFALTFQIQIRNFPLWQQTIVVLSLGFLILLLQCLVLGIIGQSTNGRYWLPVLSTALFWPWLYFLLRECQQRYMSL